MTTATCEPVCSIHDRPRWLAERRKGIGSSDAPAILGLSPYASPLSVYTDKLGLGEERVESEAMRWGRRLEPLVIEAFAAEVDRGCEPNHALLRSTARPWQLATLDAVQVKRDAPRLVGLLEVKTSGYGREDWDEGLPLYVNAQVQHQFSVTGYEWGSVAVLVGGQKLLWVDVERDDRFINDLLLPAEEEFWSRVQEKIPPPPDGTMPSGEALKLLYPTHAPGKVVTLPGEFIDLDGERLRLQADMKEAKAKLDAIDQQLKAAIGDAEAGIVPGGITYTYKLQHRKETLMAATSFRVLRRSES